LNIFLFILNILSVLIFVGIDGYSSLRFDGSNLEILKDKVGFDKEDEISLLFYLNG